MYLYFNKNGTLTTQINHGEIPRQGANLRVCALVDLNFFSENLDPILDNWTAYIKVVDTKGDSVISSQTMGGLNTGGHPEMITFAKANNAEVTFNLIPGQSYYAFEYIITPEIYPGVTALSGNIKVGITFANIVDSKDVVCGEATVYIEPVLNASYIRNTINPSQYSQITTQLQHRLPLSGGTLSGPLSTKKLTVTDEGIEIYDDTTPYIDFHYENGSEDFTLRLVETPQGTLNVLNNTHDAKITIEGSEVALKSEIPTTFIWTNGDTSGPTGTLSSSDSSITFNAIPAASKTHSGIVTTGSQTFSGVKTFSSVQIASNNSSHLGVPYTCTIYNPNGNDNFFLQLPTKSGTIATTSDCSNSYSVCYNLIVNMNQQQFEGYKWSDVSIEGYENYTVKQLQTQNGEKVTDTSIMKSFLKFMTGNDYLPQYNATEPRNVFLITSSANQMWKIQYDFHPVPNPNNGLLAFLVEHVPFLWNDEQDYTNTITYLNGFSNRQAYVNIKRSNKELKIVISGTFDIDQEHFTPGNLQTPIQFELDEETSRKLYVGNSNTAAGNICALPSLYYNDRTYITTVCAGYLKRVSENGNVYTIMFNNNELTSESTITDFQFRVTLEL